MTTYVREDTIRAAMHAQVAEAAQEWTPYTVPPRGVWVRDVTADQVHAPQMLRWHGHTAPVAHCLSCFDDFS